MSSGAFTTRRGRQVAVRLLAGSLLAGLSPAIGECDVMTAQPERRAEPRIMLSIFQPDEAAEADTRITSPVVKEMPEKTAGTDGLWSLRRCFDSLYSRRGDRKAAGSWSGYRTLVRAWEEFHGGEGPDVRSLTEESLMEFFAAQQQWATMRSWVKNRCTLYAILKSVCPRTVANRSGLSTGAVLEMDRLVVWELPEERWFRDRKSRLQPTVHPGHRRRNLPLLSVTEFDRVLLACERAEYLDPVWWRTLLGWWWYCGTRCRDTLQRLNWSAGRNGDGVDLRQKTLTVNEHKCGGQVQIPLPTWLCSGLHELRRGGHALVFHQSASDRANLDRRFYPQYREIWRRSGIDTRMPHELRGVAISQWFKHAPKYRFHITGHSPGADVQLKHYVTIDDEFRAVADAYPQPSIRLDTGEPL